MPYQDARRVAPNEWRSSLVGTHYPIKRKRGLTLQQQVRIGIIVGGLWAMTMALYLGYVILK
jgi:hypothetical protein